MTSLRGIPIRQRVALAAGFSIIAFFGAVAAAILGQLVAGTVADLLRDIGQIAFAVSLPSLMVSSGWYWWLTRRPVSPDSASINISLYQGVALAAGFSIIAFFGAVAAGVLGMLAAGRAGELLRGIGLGVFAVSLPALVVFVVWYCWLTSRPINSGPANIETPPANARGALFQVYFSGTIFTGELIYIGAWIYFIDEHGFLLGVSLGWLPALIAAVVLSWFWPLMILAAVGGVVFLVGFT